jgi:ketosteroid isomerase-like protein
MRGTRTGGEKTDLWFRHTVCFRKVDGTWKIVHFHESVPFYMDGSYKAAIDLKP